MDDKGTTDGGAEESTSDKTTKKNNAPDKPEFSKKPDVTIIVPDTAGPSGFANLPGAIALTPKPIHKPGLSKSEQNLSQISVKDVADALKLTSVSFGTNNPVIKNLNLRDLKIPLEKCDNDNQHKDETATFIDLKKFMASCFKSNRETPATVSEVPVQNIQATIPYTERIQEAASSNIAHTEIKGVPTKPTGNEVIVVPTQPPPDDKEKVTKKDSNEKKKTSGSLSERSDLALAQRDSLSSIGSNVCRICMTRGRERLISPCNCKGSLANVHLTCLERWLNQVGRNHCELCGYRVRPDCGHSHCCSLDIRDFNALSYPAIRTPRYTVLQALRLWFGNPRNRSHLQSDCLIFWLLSTVTAGLLAVCIVGTQYFVIEGSKFGKLDHGVRKEEGISHRITETAMDFFMAIVLCGYSVTVYLLWKDHYVMWNRWRRANVNVRLLLAPDSNPVPFVPRTDNRYSVV